MTALLSRVRALPKLAINAFKRDTANFSSRHVYFGLVAVFGFPLYYYVWHDLFPQPYENLPLRLVGAAVFIPVVFSKLWPEPLKRFFPLYWYVALLLALPTFFTYMLLQNEGSTVWLLSSLVALFIMILLLDAINLLIHIAVGVLIAVAAYDFTAGFPALAMIASLEYVPIFLFAIAMGIIVSYTGEKMRAERQQAMLATAGMVAHELRTPLSSIKAGATGVRQHLPVLLESYELATKNQLVTGSIRPVHLESMAGVLDRIEAEADRSNTVIDMLLYSVRGLRMKKEEFVTCSMAHCVDVALRRYPFNSEKDRALVQWKPRPDFTFVGVEMLMVHVIFNLLKNALRHISLAGKGTIAIALEAGEQECRLVFRDTGPGIPADVLPHIFTRYYSWPKHGDGIVETTGIGLSFCREVINAFGGTIDCRSRIGEFSEFLITFPRSYV
ncbi:MAG: HAMP domain-containing histidine kinase [Betaproteobacteria bacterium]|nr:MAG: HAMP domain-containing histidine kinase [Betaproteobacteria bacterium]